MDIYNEAVVYVLSVILFYNTINNLNIDFDVE